MSSLMDSVGRLIVSTLDNTFSYVSVLYDFFSVPDIVLNCLFVYLGYRVILHPILGGHIGPKSDSVRRDIKRDKEEASDG